MFIKWQMRKPGTKCIKNMELHMHGQISGRVYTKKLTSGDLRKKSTATYGNVCSLSFSLFPYSLKFWYKQENNNNNNKVCSHSPLPPFQKLFPLTLLK